MSTIVIDNAKIAGDSGLYDGWVVVEDGIIAETGKGNGPHKYAAAKKIDLKGHLLLPGVIDSHVHFREPGLESKATIRSESRAAAAGGVTSFMEMPNTVPPTTTLEALDDKYRRAAKDSLINYSFYIGATCDNIDELRRVDYSRCPGIKVFMGSSTGGMLVEGDEVLEKIFSLGALVAVHCESEEIIRENMKRLRAMYGERPIPVSWHPQVRSVLACYESTKHAVELARHLGTRLHVMHLSTAQELELFTPCDKRITAEACVAHLLFSDSDYLRLGARIKCNPAVKSAMHRDALRRALKNGLITTVSTDHAPHELREKELPSLSAPSGMPMVQFSLIAMLEFARMGMLDVVDVVRLISHNQADTFGVEGRGYIRPGYAADLVEVDPEGGTVINPQDILSRCGWSPLEGARFSASVERTWVNGKVVWNRKAGGIIETSPAQPLSFVRS